MSRRHRLAVAREVTLDDAERARLEATDQGDEDWRGWRPTIVSGALRVIDATAVPVLELRAKDGRAALDTIDAQVAVPTAAFGAWVIGRHAPGGRRLSVAMAKRGPWELVVELRASSERGVDVTLTVLPAAPDEERSALRVVLDPPARWHARSTAHDMVVRVRAGERVRLRIARSAAWRPRSEPDVAATLGTRAREAEAFLARLLPRSTPLDDARIARRLIAEVLSSDAADGWEAGFASVALARVDPTEARRLARRATEDGVHGPGTAWPATPPIGAWVATRLARSLRGRVARERFLEASVEHLLGVTSGLLDEQDARGRNVLRGALLSVGGGRQLPAATGLTVADGPAWVAAHVCWMVSLAGELARRDPLMDDVVVTLLDTVVGMIDSLEAMGGGVPMWDADAGGYRPVASGSDGTPVRLPLHALVSCVPVLGVAVVPGAVVERSLLVADRIDDHLRDRPELSGHIIRGRSDRHGRGDVLIALASRARLGWALESLLHPDIGLSPWGVRSLAVVRASDGDVPSAPQLVNDAPRSQGAWDTDGRPIWSGQVHVAMTALVADALRRQGSVRDAPVVAHPTGSGHLLTLGAVADDLERRVLAPMRIAQAGEEAWRPDGAWDARDGRALGMERSVGAAALMTILTDDARRHGSAGENGPAG